MEIGCALFRNKAVSIATRKHRDTTIKDDQTTKMIFSPTEDVR